MNTPSVNQNNNVVQGTMNQAENIASNITGSVKKGFSDVSNWFSGLISGNKSSQNQPQQITTQTTPTTMGGKRKTKKYRKGSRSKTRRGRKDFITHKGSKKYNRRGHRQSRNSRGRKGRPYSRRNRKGGFNIGV